MARSLLIPGQIDCERPSVHSVTTETATNVSFQNAPSRRSSVDQLPGNDLFAGLVDSNTASSANNGAVQAHQQPSAAQHWSNNNAPASDNSRWNNSGPSNPPPGNNANNNNNSGNQ